jgi:hypothetical protein
VASVVYGVALALDVRAATNLAFYYVATPVGALLWIAGIVVCVGRARRRIPMGSGNG